MCGHQARSRQGHAAARESVGIVVEHDLERGDDVVEIGQRLAHAHHHHVGDRMAPMLDPGRGDAVGEQRAIGMPQLPDDLADAQVAVEALLSGRAECAVERATGLRRDAQRAAIGFRNVNGLDRVRVADVEQPFARAVGRGRVANDRRGADLGIARERLARRFGQVAHRVDSVGEPMVDPAQRLLGAKRLFSALGEKRRHRGGVEVEQIDHLRHQRR